MTKLISGFPCIGKTTLGNSNKFKYMDLEFRETASSRGMNKKQTMELYNNYISIIKNIYQTGYYDYLMITDNEILLGLLVLEQIPFTYVVPNPDDKEYLELHKDRVLHRNDLTWYQNIILPRLPMLSSQIEKFNNCKQIDILFLSKNKPFLTDVLNITK